MLNRTHQEFEIQPCYERGVIIGADMARQENFNNLHSALRCAIALFAVATFAGCSESQDPVSLFKEGAYERSFVIFRERAASGDDDARNYVGIHYYLGLGTDKDYPEAIKWFEPAALNGHADAMRNLGIMYMRGLGVEQDWSMAYAWLYHAVQNGHEHAEDYLSVSADYVTPNKSMQQRKLIEEKIRDYRRQQTP